MGWITARRRHPAAGYAVVLLGLLVIAAFYAAVTGGGGDASAASPVGGPQAQINAGQRLFTQNCSTCHGLEAQGKSGIAPSLIGVGAAAVDFQVSTGRMPAREPDAEIPASP